MFTSQFSEASLIVQIILQTACMRAHLLFVNGKNCILTIVRTERETMEH